MNAQELAHTLAPLLAKVNAPMTPDNAHTTLAIYDTLGKMARGELILIAPPATVPGKD